MFVAGSVLICWLVRLWRPRVEPSTAAGFGALVLVFFAAPLTTDRLQVAVDIPYQWLPLSAMVEGGP